jgi:Na+-driven multidrug efflux pump
MTIIAPIRAAGDTRFVMIMGIVTAAFALLGIALAIRAFHLGLWGVPLGWTAAWIVRSSLTTARLNNGDWERRPSLVQP